MESFSHDLWLVAPEMFVATMACVILLADLFVLPERRGVIFGLAQAGLIGALLLSVSQSVGEPVFAFGGMYVADKLAVLLKVFIFLTVMGGLVYSRHYLKEWGFDRGEYLVLVLLATLGMMVMASGSHLLTLYLGLELLSLALYVLVAFNRDSGLAAEAAIKYFVLGTMASGMLLYGLSLLYGLTGDLNVIAINSALADFPEEKRLALTFALVFIVIGLAFKLGAVPFHMWLPDVYHGAPATVTLFIGTAPKLAALALTIRLLVDGLSALAGEWQQMLMLLAVLSLVIGNLVAIAQHNIKRMLAYSTIGHIGFVLLGLAVGSAEGYGAAVFSTLIYALMGLGAFGVVVLLSRDGHEAEELLDFKGLAERNAWLAFLMALFMFSMAGVPPTVGFYAKLVILQVLLEAGHVWVALAAVLLSVVGAFYYLRVIKLMFMDDPESGRSLEDAGWGRWGVAIMSINGLAMVVLGLFPGWLLVHCYNATGVG